MRHYSNKKWGWFITVVAAISAVALTVSEQDGAKANGRYKSAYSVDTVRAGSAHQSLIRIRDEAVTPVRRNVYVGLGKSVLVEFPRDIRRDR